jgi:hypothetical protein
LVKVHEQDALGVAAGGDEAGDAVGERAGLAGAGAGEHEELARGGLDDGDLLRVELAW